MKELLIEAQEEIFDEAMESIDECPNDCEYLSRYAGLMGEPPFAECICDVETDCPRVTETLVSSRAGEKMEEIANGAEALAEAKGENGYERED